MDTMLVDCFGCAAQGPTCADCVVSALLGVPDGSGGEVAGLAADERAALEVLASGGLLPPLRLVRAVCGEGRRARVASIA